MGISLMHWDRSKRIAYGFDIGLLVNRLDSIFKLVSLRSVEIVLKISLSGSDSLPPCGASFPKS